MDISIVIPAFNEEKKIVRDINAASDFAQKNDLSAEIIVVDDGSTDTTYDKAATCQTPPQVKLSVIRSPQNMGKGHAVKTGIQNSTADYVMFADSGCCVPYDDTLKAIEMLKSDICDIAHASRKMPGCNIKTPQPLHRRICSKLFRFAVMLLTHIPAKLTDTQCGFKVYKGPIARQLYKNCTTDGFMFDIEIISRALKNNYRIKEFPITWTCDLDSRLTPHKSFHSLLIELIKVKLALSKHKKD